jgi:hypothetical protein
MNNVITSVGVLTLGVTCAKKSASSCIVKNCNYQSSVAPRYFEGMYFATLIFVRIQRRITVNALFSTLAKLAIGRRDVFMPMGKLFRSKKVVKCPETGEPAEILVETSPGSPFKPKKKRFSIRDCSLWPKRKGCTQSCEK